MSGPREHRTAPSDGYEALEMTASGEVVHRDKHVARGAALAMIPMALLFALVTVLAFFQVDGPGQPRALAFFPFALFAGTVFLILTGTVVRTVVTRDEVLVHWGFRGPRIPIAGITRCEVWNQPAGALPAARVGFGAYASRGSVLVEWKTPAGAEKKALFPASDPALVVAEIQAQRARVSGVAATGVRVDASGQAGSAVGAEQGTARAGEKEAAGAAGAKSTAG